MANCVCLAPACLQVASNVVWESAPNWYKMNPCADFDKMVCHNFNDKHPTDSYRLGFIGRRNERIIRGIVEGSYVKAIDYQATLGTNV